jgi:hypothetical protein
MLFTKLKNGPSKAVDVHHEIKSHGGAELQLQAFLTWEPDKDE